MQVQERCPLHGNPDDAGVTRAERGDGFVAVSVVLVAAFAVWGYLDIAPSARVTPGHPERHRTDFSVYTTAGAAFFDGRDPYAARNPRGWSYLYPPIFALMVAPLSKLDTATQAILWYGLSVFCVYGVYVESCRLWRRLGSSSPRLGKWVAVCAGLTVLLPTLECLQRGQVGIALLYAMLVGLRLVQQERGRVSTFLGGVLLTWPLAVKLIPALPVAFLLWQSGVLALSSGASRRDPDRAAVLGLGMLAGALLFLLVFPAAFLGWRANLKHLTTWAAKVVTSPDAGNQARFHIDSTSNQSFPNAAYRLATALRGTRPEDPEWALLKYARNEGEIRWARDRALAERRKADTTTRRIVLATQVFIALLLLKIGTFTRRDDPSEQVAGFGLASVATLILSPVAWTHYYMAMIPAVLAVPVWLDRRGLSTAARISAATPALLVLTHFLAKPWVGPVGLLGLGIALWFLAVAGALAVGRGFVPADHSLYRPARDRRHRRPTWQIASERAETAEGTREPVDSRFVS